MSELLSISKIRRDGDLQPRAMMNAVAITEYAEDLENGATFPPVVVYHDGQTYWLADGFHRVAAAVSIGQPAIEAEVRPGHMRDAILWSVQANRAHGLRRSDADKRKAVLTLLRDPQWAMWSDREMARRTATSHTFVAKLRGVTGNVASERRFVTRGGTEAVMDTAGISEANRARQQVLLTDAQESRWAPGLTPHPADSDVPRQSPAQQTELGGEGTEIASATLPAADRQPNAWAPSLAGRSDAPVPVTSEKEGSTSAVPEEHPSVGQLPAPIDGVRAAPPIPAQRSAPTLPAPVTPSEQVQPKDAVLTMRIAPDFEEMATRRIMVAIGDEGKGPGVLYRGFLSEAHRLLDRALAHHLGGKVLELFHEPAHRAEPAERKVDPALPFPVGAVVMWGHGQYGTVESFSSSLANAYVLATNGERKHLPVFMLKMVESAELQEA